MSKEEAAPLVAQREPQSGRETQSSLPTPIVTHLPADVKQLRDLSERRHIPTADLVEVVRTLYPKFDRFLLSRCGHGEETGVMLRPDALKALMVRFAEDGGKPRKDQRKRPNRCQCRLTDAVYALVRKELDRTGKTMQDWLETLIIEHIAKEQGNGEALQL